MNWKGRVNKSAETDSRYALEAQRPELTPAERRRMALAEQLEFVVAQHHGPGLGMLLIKAFEHHYGDMVLPDDERETPDRVWVE